MKKAVVLFTIVLVVGLFTANTSLAIARTAANQSLDWNSPPVLTAAAELARAVEQYGLEAVDIMPNHFQRKMASKVMSESEATSVEYVSLSKLLLVLREMESFNSIVATYGKVEKEYGWKTARVIYDIWRAYHPDAETRFFGGELCDANLMWLPVRDFKVSSALFRNVIFPIPSAGAKEITNSTIQDCLFTSMYRTDIRDSKLINWSVTGGSSVSNIRVIDSTISCSGSKVENLTVLKADLRNVQFIGSYIEDIVFPDDTGDFNAREGVQFYDCIFGANVTFPSIVQLEIDENNEPGRFLAPITRNSFTFRNCEFLAIPTLNSSFMVFADFAYCGGKFPQNILDEWGEFLQMKNNTFWSDIPPPPSTPTDTPEPKPTATYTPIPVPPTATPTITPIPIVPSMSVSFSATSRPEVIQPGVTNLKGPSLNVMASIVDNLNVDHILFVFYQKVDGKATDKTYIKNFRLYDAFTDQQIGPTVGGERPVGTQEDEVSFLFSAVRVEKGTTAQFYVLFDLLPNAPDELTIDVEVRNVAALSVGGIPIIAENTPVCFEQFITVKRFGDVTVTPVYCPEDGRADSSLPGTATFLTVMEFEIYTEFSVSLLNIFVTTDKDTLPPFQKLALKLGGNAIGTTASLMETAEGKVMGWNLQPSPIFLPLPGHSVFRFKLDVFDFVEPGEVTLQIKPGLVILKNVQTGEIQPLEKITGLPLQCHWTFAPPPTEPMDTPTPEPEVTEVPELKDTPTATPTEVPMPKAEVYLDTASTPDGKLKVTVASKNLSGLVAYRVFLNLSEGLRYIPGSVELNENLGAQDYSVNESPPNENDDFGVSCALVFPVNGDADLFSFSVEVGKMEGNEMHYIVFDSSFAREEEPYSRLNDGALPAEFIGVSFLAPTEAIENNSASSASSSTSSQ